jgi:hypothetical protein
MKIFSMPNQHEEYRKINYPFGGMRPEPRLVSLNQSGVTTALWALVTPTLVKYPNMFSI